LFNRLNALKILNDALSPAIANNAHAAIHRHFGVSAALPLVKTYMLQNEEAQDLQNLKAANAKLIPPAAQLDKDELNFCRYVQTRLLKGEEGNTYSGLIKHYSEKLHLARHSIAHKDDLPKTLEDCKEMRAKLEKFIVLRDQANTKNAVYKEESLKRAILHLQQLNDLIEKYDYKFALNKEIKSIASHSKTSVICNTPDEVSTTVTNYLGASGTSGSTPTLATRASSERSRTADFKDSQARVNCTQLSAPSLFDSKRTINTVSVQYTTPKGVGITELHHTAPEVKKLGIEGYLEWAIREMENHRAKFGEKKIFINDPDSVLPKMLVGAMVTYCKAQGYAYENKTSVKNLNPTTKDIHEVRDIAHTLAKKGIINLTTAVAASTKSVAEEVKDTAFEPPSKRP